MTKLIAEFCQNHNGSFETLKRMIYAAAESGATHGKMQTIFADTVSFRPQFEEGLVVDGIVKSIKRPFKEEYERLKALEISDNQTLEFINICKQSGLIPMTTCFVRRDVNHLKDLGFKSIKIASYDCASFPLIKEISNKFDEIIISTGATFDEEIIHTARILKETDFSFLHCVTIYPTPLEKMNLARMSWLRKYTASVGFSDHSSITDTGNIASLAALTLGAEIIERHFTILPRTDTRDGPVSIDAEMLMELKDFSSLSQNDKYDFMDKKYPEWKVSIGQETRDLSHSELLNRDYYRGRFASPRVKLNSPQTMIYNWEETPL